MRMGVLMLVPALAACTDSHKVTITFAGDGAGWVETGDMRCTSSCTIENAPSVVHLLAGTPSSFGGWSSGCDNAQDSVGENDCEVRGDHDVDLTVTFNRDPGELATLFPTDDVTALAFVGDDLVIASGTAGTIRRVGFDGTIRWAIAGNPVYYGPVIPERPPPNLAVSTTGDVYTLEGVPTSHSTYGPEVAARRGNGSLKWMGTRVAGAVAATPDGGVVVLTNPVTRLAAADGSTVWSADVANASAVAVDSTGMTAVATTDGTVERFDAAGTRLMPDWTLPVAGMPSIAFDAQDDLVVQILDFQRPDSQGGDVCAPGGRTLARLDRTGNAVFRVDEDCNFGRPAALLPNGSDLFSFQSGTYQGDPATPPSVRPGGLLLRTYGFDGAQGAWSFSKSAGITNDRLTITGAVSATAATCDGHGRCAIGGTYTLGAGSYWPVVTSPWVEVLSSLSSACRRAGGRACSSSNGRAPAGSARRGRRSLRRSRARGSACWRSRRP